jgi:hypothetical protein
VALAAGRAWTKLRGEESKRRFGGRRACQQRPGHDRSKCKSALARSKPERHEAVTAEIGGFSAKGYPEGYPLSGPLEKGQAVRLALLIAFVDLSDPHTGQSGRGPN